MSQRAGNVLILIIIILLNLYFMSSGGHGGRGQDYYESQTDVDYSDESP